MRGDLGALLGADPLRALLGQPAHEPQPPRREDERRARPRRRHGEHDVAVAATSAPLSQRKTSAAADDERTRRARRSRPRGARGAAAAAARRRRPAGACARAGGSTTAARCDWRQISAPPPPASTSGQTTASPNHMPHARNSSSAASVSSTIPPATCQLSRRPSDAREPAVARAPRPPGISDPADEVERDPDAAGDGRDHEADPQDQRVDPEPRRRGPRRRRRAASRRGDGGAARAASRARPSTRMFSPGSAPRGPVSPQASRMPPTAAEHGREHVVEAHVDHVGLVEQQDQAERDHDHARDQRGGVEAGARRSWRPRAGDGRVVAGRVVDAWPLAGPVAIGEASRRRGRRRGRCRRRAAACGVPGATRAPVDDVEVDAALLVVAAVDRAHAGPWRRWSRRGRRARAPGSRPTPSSSGSVVRPGGNSTSRRSTRIAPAPIS